MRVTKINEYSKNRKRIEDIKSIFIEIEVDL